MSERYVVTGAAGFIGAQVSRLLLEQGHTVIGVDNVNDAYDPRMKVWRLRQLEADPLFHFHRLDITRFGDLGGLFEALARQPAGNGARGGAPCAAVLNLAARAGVRPSVENPWIYYETNVLGTLNLLEICRQFGVGKFVLASSSSLYGARDGGPFEEDSGTDAPLSPYAASKKAAEVLCSSYQYLHGVDVSVLRYFTVYGPAGRPDMSLFRFVQWISEGRPVVIYGDGTQRRDFTYVEDIARGSVAALRPLGYEVVNLGSDRPVALAAVIALIEELTGRPAQVKYRDAAPADVPATWASIAKARRLLGWQPRVSLQEGVAALVEWYQENRAWARSVATGDAAPARQAVRA
ncbi:MAG: NAD-dependent epimerase/dehydratase family protein [Candidatus Latescibacterota bacterium]